MFAESVIIHHFYVRLVFFFLSCLVMAFVPKITKMSSSHAHFAKMINDFVPFSEIQMFCKLWVTVSTLSFSLNFAENYDMSRVMSKYSRIDLGYMSHLHQNIFLVLRCIVDSILKTIGGRGMCRVMNNQLRTGANTREFNCSGEAEFCPVL